MGVTSFVNTFLRAGNLPTQSRRSQLPVDRFFYEQKIYPQKAMSKLRVHCTTFCHGKTMEKNNFLHECRGGIIIEMAFWQFVNRS